MAIASNSDTKTVKLFLSSSYSGSNMTVEKYDNGFRADGTWDTGTYGATPDEESFVDIGFVNDEREELVIGAIQIALPITGADQTGNWAIMGKVLRATISGTIPDGLYVSTGVLSGKSNSSVFKYKMSKLFAYAAGVSLMSHTVKYRRRYLNDVNGYNAVSNWTISSYSFGFIEGTRVLKYTITLDMANNINTSDPLQTSSTNISTREFGSI